MEHIHYWQNVPSDVLILIFSGLSFKDFITSSLTCKNWHDISNNRDLWNLHLKQCRTIVANSSEIKDEKDFAKFRIDVIRSYSSIENIRSGRMLHFILFKGKLIDSTSYINASIDVAPNSSRAIIHQEFITRSSFSENRYLGSYYYNICSDRMTLSLQKKKARYLCGDNLEYQIRSMISSSEVKISIRDNNKKKGKKIAKIKLGTVNKWTLGRKIDSVNNKMVLTTSTSQTTSTYSLYDLRKGIMTSSIGYKNCTVVAFYDHIILLNLSINIFELWDFTTKRKIADCKLNEDSEAKVFSLKKNLLAVGKKDGSWSLYNIPEFNDNLVTIELVQFSKRETSFPCEKLFTVNDIAFDQNIMVLCTSVGMTIWNVVNGEFINFIDLFKCKNVFIKQNRLIVNNGFPGEVSIFDFSSDKVGKKVDVIEIHHDRKVGQCGYGSDNIFTKHSVLPYNLFDFTKSLTESNVIECQKILQENNEKYFIMYSKIEGKSLNLLASTIINQGIKLNGTRDEYYEEIIKPTKIETTTRPKITASELIFGNAIIFKEVRKSEDDPWRFTHINAIDFNSNPFKYWLKNAS